jgi:hypothetical protein
MKPDLTIWDRDTLGYRIPVTRTDTGAALDLTGATVTVRAARLDPAGSAAPGVAGTGNVPVPASGEIEVFFGSAALAPGTWSVQVTVQKGADIQTVDEAVVLVRRSHADP